MLCSNQFEGADAAAGLRATRNRGSCRQNTLRTWLRPNQRCHRRIFALVQEMQLGLNGRAAATTKLTGPFRQSVMEAKPPGGSGETLQRAGAERCELRTQSSRDPVPVVTYHLSRIYHWSCVRSQGHVRIISTSWNRIAPSRNMRSRSARVNITVALAPRASWVRSRASRFANSRLTPSSAAGPALYARSDAFRAIAIALSPSLDRGEAPLRLGASPVLVGGPPLGADQELPSVGVPQAEGATCLNGPEDRASSHLRFSPPPTSVR